MRVLRFLVATVCAVGVVAGLVAPAGASTPDVTTQSESAETPENAPGPGGAETTNPQPANPEATNPGAVDPKQKLDPAETGSPSAPPVAKPSKKSVKKVAAAPQAVTAPENDSTPVATGPTPKVASSMSPATSAIVSGTTRTYTVTYENEGTTTIANARLWHQLMVGANHVTNFTVTCASTVNGSTGGNCPTWVPAGTQAIPSGQSDEHYLTYAGVFSIQGLQKLTFTITVTSAFAAGVCTEDGTTTTGGWARFSRTGFALTDIDVSASSIGSLTGATVCAAGDIVMTNAGLPASRVLSGDPRTFTVTWENTSSTSNYASVPLRYTYYVPNSGQITEATWNCATSINGGAPTACAAPMNAPGSATVNHGGPGGVADTVFSWNADFAPKQKYTLTVKLVTTINSCTQAGYLDVQTFAKRGKIGSETSDRSKGSGVLQVGCSTWMLNEPFNTSSVTDTAWKPLNSACLTRSSTAGTTTTLGQCTNRVNSPTRTLQDAGGNPLGYLQFTDDSTNKVGAVLYNRALPSSDGVVAEFTQYQYGTDAAGADGIGFFLADGAYELTTAGDSGGALGYAYREPGQGGANGLGHGYLGLGLDVYGNYVNGSHTAPGCNQTSYVLTSQSVGLRGSGNARSGYCLLAQKQVSASPLNKRLDYSSATITNSYQTGTAAQQVSYDDQLRTALGLAKRKVRVTVHPTLNPTDKPRVTVEIDFNDGNFYQTVLDTTMDQPAPSLIKFGFMGATGGSKQVHLIGDVRVGTVLPMKELNLVKVVDYSQNADPAKQIFDVGDTINYKFMVYNATQESSGITDIYKVLLTDPLVSNVACPKSTLARSESMSCTGSLVVTEANRDAGRVRNTATVAGAISSDPSAPRPLTARSSVDVPVNPSADNATRVIAPGGTATFQTLKYGASLGLVQPDDPSKITIKLIDPATNQPTAATSITASGQGTWAINANNTVTFTPINGTFSGTVTPMKYQASNAFGGSAIATLSVTISIVPLNVCTVDEQRASESIWAFGSNAKLTFPATGTGAATAGNSAGLNGALGTFTVTDSASELQFVVDPGNGGRILNRNGAAILNSLGTPTSGTAPNGGASQATVFPAGQGTDKFFVVVSSATANAAGQLSYWIVDMSLNGGLGGVVGPTAGTALGGSGTASTAVTSVPNADATGYWVLSPNKRGNSILAYKFDETGPTNAASPVSSSVGSTVIASPNGVISTAYEDIRFNADLSRVATMASNNTTNAGSNSVRLMTFNAATGALSLVRERAVARANNNYGYNVEFSPNGNYLFASRIGIGNGTTTSRRAAIFRAQITTNNWTFSSLVTAPNSPYNGGMIGLGPNQRLYWAQNGGSATSSVRQATFSTDNGTLSWSDQPLSPNSTSYGLSQTLSDCAIAPAKFNVQKLDGDGVAVGGAEFALYKDDNGAAAGTPVIASLTPGAGTGAFIAEGVAPGSYWLRETKAPAGHSLLPQDILIEVRLRGQVILDSTSNPQVTLVNSGGIYTLRVSDLKALALPFAGGQWLNPVSVGGALALLIAFAGIWWWRRRQRPPVTGSPSPGGVST